MRALLRLYKTGTKWLIHRNSELCMTIESILYRACLHRFRGTNKSADAAELDTFNAPLIGLTADCKFDAWAHRK